MAEEIISLTSASHLKVRAIDRVEEVAEGQYRIYSIYDAVIGTYWEREGVLDLGETVIRFHRPAQVRFERQLKNIVE